MTPSGDTGSLLQGAPAATAARRRLRSSVCIVTGIAVTHVCGTQLAQRCVHYPQLTPMLLVWFATNCNLLLLTAQLCRRREMPPLLGPWAESPGRLALLAAPFFVLWTGANGLYIQALSELSSSLIVSIFSVTPAFVAVLALPILGRPLSLLSALAVAVSIAGVVLAAEPWAFAAAGAPLPLGFLCALGASCCAALYKVYI